MRRYAAHDWRADPTNLLIISPTGGGKTYLACALGISACHNGHAVTYARMDDLARRLVIARHDSISHQKLLSELSETDLLIIDDFLTIGIHSDAASDLFAILANRQHRLPTVIGSQTGPAHWSPSSPTESLPTPSSTGSPTTPEPSTSTNSTRADSATNTPKQPRTTGNNPHSGPATNGRAATTSPKPRYQLPGLAPPRSATRQNSDTDLRQ